MDKAKHRHFRIGYDPTIMGRPIRLQCLDCGEPVTAMGPYTLGCLGCDPDKANMDTRTWAVELLGAMAVQGKLVTPDREF